MLKVANQTIKSVSSNAIVLAAGISPYTFSYGTWIKWLTDFSNLSPQNYFDFQGVHLYDENTTNDYIISQTRNIMQKDVWITEIGSPSAPSPYSDQEQTSYIVSNFQMLASLNKPVFWYQLKDETNAKPDKENHFGLFDYQNNPKGSSIPFTTYASKPS
jgi:hypothetical protein